MIEGAHYAPLSEERKKDLLLQLIPALYKERGIMAKLDVNASSEDLFSTFRSLVNTRPAAPASEDFLAMQNELLQGLIAEKGIVGIEASSYSENPRIRMWRGDICCIEADAIVNAANSQMLGCWAPGHLCIDNAIHTFAGVQLRLECAELMEEQGHEEETGQAKITSAWNLPSGHVLHTVGPIAQGNPSDVHRAQLAMSYTNCLSLAAANDLHSVVFCCISTGVFGFPQEEAARIAVNTVSSWLSAHEEADITVVFNVFLESDERIYKDLLGLS